MKPLHFEAIYDIYDISVRLGGAPLYPGDPIYGRQMVSTTESGGPCNLSEVTFSAHAGTHIDSPAHFLSWGKTIDEYPPQRFILPAHVLSVKDPHSIKPSDLKGLAVDPGDALLFKTDNSRRGLLKTEFFSEDYVFVEPETAERCAEMGISLAGIDYLSVDRFGDSSYPAHKMMLENDILILEGIDLKDISPGRYLLLCLPLKIEGEASPVRAVLMR
jgi:arylformamidase